MATERPARRSRTSEMMKRKCKLCEDQVQIDYKQPDMLKRFLTERGKILSRRLSGNCARHQRAVTLAIKLARNMMLIK
jgi:small subunit ribosomal protein S18